MSLPRPRPARVLRVIEVPLLKLIAALAIVLAVLTAGAWWLAGRGVPAMDGQRTLSGLVAPVEILFDAFAIPHVYARGEIDVWLTAGYLHGRDRLWQMEVYRRAAAGRLSEAFGEETLPLDRTFLRLGFRRAAAEEWKRLVGPARSALERYALGVNLAIAESGGLRLPLEFRLVGVRPEPWTPADSLAIAKLMSYRLTENRRGELVRGLLVSRVGPYAAALLPDPPSWAPTIAQDATAGGSEGLAMSGSYDPGAPVRPRTARHWDPGAGRAERLRARDPLRSSLHWLLAGRAGGSSSWVVSGRHTASGRPLLANDPHLAVEMPSVWYEAHYIAGTLDVQGVTIPGAPFVIIGHNRSVAWGVTNAGADVEDFYEEQIDWTARRYRTAGGWTPLRVETRDVQVRGRDTVERFDVFSTSHGPVASEDEWADPMFDPPHDTKDPKARWLSLRRLDAPGAAAGLHAINHASSWQEFTAAVSRTGQPPLSFVYADTGGNIGYAMSGRVPLRGGWDGGTPVPGPSGLEWRGVMDWGLLPRAFNPPSGQIVAANNEIDRESRLTRDWVAPFRAVRIRDMLAERGAFDVEAFARMQNDVTSRGADRVLQAVEEVLASPRALSIEAPIRAILDRLRLWDRRVDGRAIVTLYEAFEQSLWTRTFSDEMDEPVFRRFYEYAARERYAGLYAVIGDAQSRWFDDIYTVDRRETRDDVIVGAAADAMTLLKRRFGSDEKDWAWDRLHAVRFDHALGAGGWPLAWWFSRGPFALGGDDTTINKTAVDRRQPYGTIELPSYRVIMDVGAWDNSRGVITTGQSGHPRSRHYFDQHPLWQSGDYHSMPFTRASVDVSTKSRMLLAPPP